MAAVKAALGTSHPVHEITVVGTPTYPYYLLWSSNGNPPVERSVRAETTDIDDTFGVTSVGLTPDSVRIIAKNARDALCPNGLPTTLAVTGRVVTVSLAESRPIQPDKDVTLQSGAHPLYGVDVFRIASVPA